jgi:hypothetical protein
LVDRDQQTEAIAKELRQLGQQQQWDAPLIDGGR